MYDVRWLTRLIVGGGVKGYTLHANQRLWPLSSTVTLRRHQLFLAIRYWTGHTAFRCNLSLYVLFTFVLPIFRKKKTSTDF